MQLPRIPLFDWLIKYLPETKYDLGNSSITGVQFSELLELTGFEIPNDLDLGKNDLFGAPELRRTLAGIYSCSENNVIPTTGGSEANLIVFLALLKPGDELIVEQPAYSPLWLVPRMLGASVVNWHRRFEDGFSLDLEALKELVNKKTKLIVITNLHNPSGVLADHDTIRAAAEIAAENGTLLFIDEMFLDGADQPQRTAVGLDGVIVTASVSKVYGIGGLRTGWVIAPAELTERCLLAKWQASVAAPYLSELMAATAMGNARAKLLDRFKNIARRDRAIVEEWMDAHNEIIDWVPPAGGIMCYPKYNAYTNSKLNSVTLGERLINESGVLIFPGKYFGLDGHFRLTFLLDDPELKHALAAIAGVLSEY